MGRVKNPSSRRQFYQKRGGDRENSLQIGQHGFLVSFSSPKESFVRNEIYNLLNRFADELFGAEFVEEKDSTKEIVDFEAALKSESEEMKASKKKIRRFQIVKSGTKHSFFVRTTIERSETNRLIENIFRTSLEKNEQHSRYVERLLPVLFVCKAYEDDFRKQIVEQSFIDELVRISDDPTETNQTIFFDVHAKKSNNNQIKSSHLEQIVIDDLHSRKSEQLNGKTFKRDYKNPKVHVLVHVIKNLLLVSIVRNYDLFKKYNLASINLVSTTEKDEPTKIQFEQEDSTDDQ